MRVSENGCVGVHSFWHERPRPLFSRGESVTALVVIGGWGKPMRSPRLGTVCFHKLHGALSPESFR